MVDGKMEEFEATVKEVFSGDDLVLMLDLGVENLYKRQRIRLDGVDTPNAIKESAETEAGKLRAYVTNLCRNRSLKVSVVSKGRNSWVGRIVVMTPTGPHDLNADLIERGYQFKEKVAV